MRSKRVVLETALPVTRRNTRSYHIEAYRFVLEALTFTLKRLKKVRHISAQEFLEGIRRYAIRQFGPMSKTVLEEWGVMSCEDFGTIIFDMVRMGLIARQDSDSPEEFRNGFDFQDAFEKPFVV